MKRLLIALVLLLSACAQDVTDIDRTQPNRLKKTDLDGQWFVAQTVTETPTTAWYTFVGDTSSMERIRWDIEEEFLIAYRTYPKIAGSQEVTDDYTESPVAAYRIASHFDVQRQYNASTGEQSNVIVENSSDRPWYEREYIRVDWSTNHVTNFDFLSVWLGYSDFSYFVDRERGLDGDAIVEGRDEDGTLNYFDFNVSMIVEPDLWGCVYSWWGYAAEDCTSARIKVRTAYMKTPEVREYEPVQYDDRWMSKFGYFRTERFGFDDWLGIRQTNRLQLANRFAIWEAVWQRDETGEILTDSDGRPIAIPMEERTPKPIVYHMSRELPENLWDEALEVGKGWDQAFRRAVAAVKGDDPADMPQMFVVCHNPVLEEDPEVCGGPGLSPNTGDIRYNHLYWVDQLTQAGLLGYGPSGADPLTGEIVFGSAYVYGAEINTYANYSKDIVRLINGDLDNTDLQDAEYISEELRRNLNSDPSRPKVRSAALKNMPIEGGISRLAPKKADKLRQLKRHGIEKLTHDRAERVRTKIREEGLDDLMLDHEMMIGKTRGQAGPGRDVPEHMKEDVKPSNWANSRALRRREATMMQAARKNVYLSAFADDAILGFATQLKDEDDDTVREKVQSAVFRAVMEHEIGHTIGLRHNFQGSYDSINYQDQYWDLRQENLINSSNLDDLYEMAEMTQAQKDGRMSEYQYSSIMDYGMRFNSDIHGLGKYDEAAIVFGYSAGTYRAEKGIEPGFVETYTNPGNARTLLRRYEDPDSLAYPSLLEEMHYTSVAQTFDSLDNMRQRTLMKYDEVKAARGAADAPVEVHYMFCSDEWAGALVSCDVWDSGADPFEIVRNVNTTYRNYYPLHHYRRDRPFHWSEDVFASMYMRYFSALTNVYQNWVFSYFYGTDDVRMDNYYLFAATAAFNQLADVMMMPQMGGYEQDDQGVWRLVDYATDPSYDLNVDYAQGRNLYTEYEYESGYYYFDRVSEVGHFWDFLAASFALTDYETTRLGVDDSADELTYSIPWYLFFEFELTDMFNGIFLQDPELAGAREVNGEIVMPKMSPLVSYDENDNEVLFDPETGEELPATLQGNPVDMDSSFTQQLYTVLYGMAFFTSNYSLNFPDQLKIFRLGNGESVTAGAGYELVTFTDPFNGFEYGALKPVGEDSYTGAARLVEQGQRWADAYANAPDDDAANDAYWELQETIDLINLARAMYTYFGVSF